MDKKENRINSDLAREEANSLRANAKKNRNNSTRKTNKLWLWLGVLVLVFILLWWLFAMGTFEDMLGVFNG
ncbi:MAG: hypothetical protein K2M87_07975 [Muribaculaceae bacterium]|nr:hypothetical protein [Muribaculaceae bacterium]